MRARVSGWKEEILGHCSVPPIYFSEYGWVEWAVEKLLLRNNECVERIGGYKIKAVVEILYSSLIFLFSWIF